MGHASGVDATWDIAQHMTSTSTMEEEASSHTINKLLFIQKLNRCWIVVERCRTKKSKSHLRTRPYFLASLSASRRPKNHILFANIHSSSITLSIPISYIAGILGLHRMHPLPTLVFRFLSLGCCNRVESPPCHIPNIRTHLLSAQ